MRSSKSSSQTFDNVLVKDFVVFDNVIFDFVTFDNVLVKDFVVFSQNLWLEHCQTSMMKILKNEHFLSPNTHTYVWVSGGKKCAFFKIFITDVWQCSSQRFCGIWQCDIWFCDVWQCSSQRFCGIFTKSLTRTLSNVYDEDFEKRTFLIP